MSDLTRTYENEDARRELAVEMLKRHVRAAGIVTDYDEDIEYMEHALLAFADEWAARDLAPISDDAAKWRAVTGHPGPSGCCEVCDDAAELGEAWSKADRDAGGLRAALRDIRSWCADIDQSTLSLREVKQKIRGMCEAALSPTNESETSDG